MDDYLSRGQVNKGLSRQQLHDLLIQRDFTRLIDLCEEDKRLWRTLWAALYEADENLRWSAIEAVAKVMERWWEAGHREIVREYMRRILWSMCAEAGEMGWSAPQTIAEIIVTIPELLEPYGSMMIARAIEEPSLVAGGLWGVGRLGTVTRGAVEPLREMILGVFGTEDAETLGLAAWAMGEVGFEAALPDLEELRDREEPARIYINGDFRNKPVCQWAREAIDKIEACTSNTGNA